jgi:hypothetical protein
MKEIYIGENNSLSIERLFDNCTISLKYGYNQRKEVEGNDILFYTTSRYICDYTNGVKNPPNVKTDKKYILLKNLRFSHGSDKNSVFHCNDLVNNLIEMDTIAVERDMKVKQLLNYDS